MRPSSLENPKLLFNPLEISKRILSLIEKQNEDRDRSINLTASENRTSPQLRMAVASDFINRYAYSGDQNLQEIEKIIRDLCLKLYRATFVDVRPTSGSNALLLTILGLSKPGSRVMVLSEEHGGHTNGPPCLALGRVPINFAFDFDEYNIDVDENLKIIEKERAELIIFGTSVFLFPHPVREIASAVDSRIAYDGSHVLGLIAGESFQDPLKEGANILFGSVHKTLPGPQKGMILSNERAVMEEVNKQIPGFISNRHLHHVAGLGVALAEMAQYGKEYAQQIVKNAKALGGYLHERGFRVLCAHKDFTKSHTLAVDVSDVGGGLEVTKLLEQADILCSSMPLSGEKTWRAKRISGIRLGTQEVTRLGMSTSDMLEVSEIFKDLLIKGKSPEAVARKVHEFMKNFKEAKYCFKMEK